MDILLFLSIGLVIGFVSGAIGIGGGVLMVPALFWLCGFNDGKASGTTLAVLVIPVLLPAAFEYYANSNIDIRAAAFIALAFAMGAWGGAWLRNRDFLPDETLRLSLGLIMTYVAVNVMIRSNSDSAKAAAGIVATVVAWITYLGLRVMGKRVLAAPRLQQQILRMDEQGRGDPDYYI